MPPSFRGVGWNPTELRSHQNTVACISPDQNQRVRFTITKRTGPLDVILPAKTCADAFIAAGFVLQATLESAAAEAAAAEGVLNLST